MLEMCFGLQASIEITQAGWLNRADFRIQIRVERALAIWRSLNTGAEAVRRTDHSRPPQGNLPGAAVEMRQHDRSGSSVLIVRLEHPSHAEPVVHSSVHPKKHLFQRIGDFRSLRKLVEEDFQILEGSATQE